MILFIDTISKPCFICLFSEKKILIDSKIYDTNIWLIEFDNENIPVREIGINNSNDPIMIMPYKNNYGFLTDNNLKLQDFKNGFEFEKISKSEFEKKWDAYQ